MDKPELSYHGKRLLQRLSSSPLLRAQTDRTEEGIANGGLYFWTEPGGKRAGPKSARELIDKGYVAPVGDGLLPETTQTWTPA